MGIVEIIIHDEVIHPFSQLEREIERLYGLKEVICVPTVGNESSKARIGAAAGQYLLRVIKDGQTIGVSSGTTLDEMVKSIATNFYYRSVTFVPLVGGLGDEKVDFHSNYIVSKLAESLQANYKLLHAPVMVDSKEAKEIVIQQSSIQNIFELASRSDIAIVGIGGIPQHSTMVKSYFGRKIRENNDFNDSIGDICYNFIDENGNVSSYSWNEKVISLPIEKLKEIPMVIGVAAGLEKVKAIKASLKGKLIDVLITDELTAMSLLQ